MKAKKKYNTGGIFPPAVESLKKRAAKKKKAPIQGGMLAETTVTAKAPTESERIKREVNKPVGSDFTFIGDPSGKIGQIGKVAKVAKSLLKSRGYKAMAKIAAKKGKQGTATLRNAQSRANTFDALEGMRAVKEGRVSNKVFNKLANKVLKGGVNPRTPYFGAKPLSDKELAKRMAGVVKEGNAKGAAYKQSVKSLKPKR
jgi:hypothetical protein